MATRTRCCWYLSELGPVELELDALGPAEPGLPGFTPPEGATKPLLGFRLTGETMPSCSKLPKKLVDWPLALPKVAEFPDDPKVPKPPRLLSILRPRLELLLP